MVTLSWQGAPAQMPRTAPAPSGIAVDVELVLAVDISYSMDPQEQTLQREGYMRGLTSREFLNAVRQGMIGKIAVTYVEWAGYYEQKVIVPWRVIEGPESADAFVSELAAAPYRRAARTSISGAIEFGSRLFETSGYRGTRRVIDVSGDGANNHGQIITIARDEALAKGITINGLPFMAKRLNYATMDIERLDIYYEDCVIGGPGSFVIPIEGPERFVEATRTKLVLEIAGLVPPVRIIPASARTPRVSCTIGERLWQERWGN
ncbi:MAG: DUF1194 domain-containing protein [Pseudorhodoplanes sp.]|nr:DUF1194 domain-containing protein [Pseudorhodoplanes sp.]MCL4711942.1 DUF1194 domain-containing protein [Pseudorhodoplanes sp.]MCQ3943329.1 hypothetical protein [Alphaproteobacteria bacterium]